MTDQEILDADAGRKAAVTVIMRSKVKKAEVIAFGTQEWCSVAYLRGATDAFHNQGPRLWLFWCQAMTARVIRGLPVPDLFDPNKGG